jgi:two-component system sensor histidine kinase/response regulator
MKKLQLKPTETQPRYSKKVNILLVDDRASNLLALEEVLSSLDENLVPVSSGKDALKELIKEEFAVVLLDVDMPEMDGYETAALIRGHAKTCALPIMFITAYDKGEPFMLEGYSIGAVDFILKPFNPEILKSKVRVYVELFRIKEELRISKELEITTNRQLFEGRALLLRDQKRFIEREKAVLKHRNNELKTFSHTVSHDLQAPLRTVIQFSQIVLKENRETLNEDSVKHLEWVVSYGQKLSSIMKSLLTYSQISSIIKEEVNIGDVIEKVISMVGMDIKEKNASVEIKGEFPALLCCSDQVTQIFLNLIGNSLKYTAEGRTPHIEIGCEEKNGITLFHIKDNGIGVEESHFSEIFKIFSRLHGDKSPYQGTGVGLTTVKKIVKIHGGKIYLESKVGEGSVFYFTLQNSKPEEEE